MARKPAAIRFAMWLAVIALGGIGVFLLLLAVGGLVILVTGPPGESMRDSTADGRAVGLLFWLGYLTGGLLSLWVAYRIAKSRN